MYFALRTVCVFVVSAGGRQQHGREESRQRFLPCKKHNVKKSVFFPFDSAVYIRASIYVQAPYVPLAARKR